MTCQRIDLESDLHTCIEVVRFDYDGYHYDAKEFHGEDALRNERAETYIADAIDSGAYSRIIVISPKRS